MAKKVQLPVIGGVRKVVNVGQQASTATTIAGLGGQTVSIAQLRALLGLTTTQTPNTVGTGGGAATGSIIVGPGLSGGGPLVGPVPIRLTGPLSQFFADEQIFDEPIAGGGSSGGGGGGASTLAALSDVNIVSPSNGQVLQYTGTKWANQNAAIGGGAAGLTQIAEVVLTSAGNIQFNNIPQTFRNLVVKLTFAATVNTAPTFQLQFNGDTGAHYAGGIVYQNQNVGAAGNGNTAQTAIQFNTPVGTNATANQASSIELTIYDYARTQWNKNVSGTWDRYDSTSTWFSGEAGGSWASTAAINSILFSLTSGSFAAGTVATLYGEGGTPTGGTSVILGNVSPDLHPSSPDTTNDEFEGSVLDPKWTLTNGTGATTTVSQGSLVFSSNNGSVDHPACLTQAISATSFTVTTKMSTAGGTGLSARGGLYVGLGGSNKLLVLGYYAPAQEFYVSRYTNPNTFSANPKLQAASAFVPALGGWLYLQVNYDGTNLNFNVSATGVPGSFIQFYTETAATFLGGAPTAVGLFSDNSALATGQSVFDWYRRTDTSGTVPLTQNPIFNNLTPDTHPLAGPTAWDDEFEVGTTIDTTGVRFPGAQAWTGFTSTTIASSVAQGALQAVTQTGSPSAGSGYAMPVPSGTWTFRWKGLRPAFEVFNLSSWKGYYFGTSGSGNSMLVQHETRNWATGSYTFGGSDASFSTNGMPAYFQLAWDGTNLVFSWSQTGYIVDFATLLTVAASTFIITPDHIGFGTSAAEAVDWIRRIA